MTPRWAPLFTPSRCSTGPTRSKASPIARTAPKDQLPPGDNDPTIAVPIDFNKPEDELTFLGTVFGTETQAAALRHGFPDEVTATVAKIRNPGTVTIVLPVAEGVRIYGSANLGGQIVTALDGTIGPDISKMNPTADGMLALVSYEQVQLITGDTILLLANLSPELKVTEGKLKESPLFQALPAVKAGRVIGIESQAFSGTAGLRGQRQILEVLAKAFAASRPAEGAGVCAPAPFGLAPRRG